MTRRLLPFALAVLTPAAAFAQHFHHHVDPDPDDNLRVSVCADNRYVMPVLDPSRQGVKWPAVTSNVPAAKDHFEQGLTLYYGFNFEDALRNFRRATELDKTFAMGWWGMALAAGPNINLNIDRTCLDMANTWSGMAWDLAKNRVGTVEYDLAKALRARYTPNGVDGDAYAAAMATAWANRKLDPEVSALYAESLMDLHPWALWDKDHKQTSPDTQKVLDALQPVLKAPNAIGANHFWIHAVEAGPDPGSAKDSAAWLDGKVTGAGHLLHMPSHTYFLTGRYAAAVTANTAAIEADQGQFEGFCAGDYDKYIKETRCQALYYGHYYSHDLFFRGVSNAFLGKNQAAIEDALATRDHAARFVPNEPGLQRYMTAPYMFYAAFGGWLPILDPKEKEPVCPRPGALRHDSGCHIARAIWHWARGMAYTTQPKDDGKAKAEQAVFRRHRNAIWTSGPNSWGNNKAVDVLAIADEMLQARIDWANGSYDAAIEDLKRAVKNEDALVYDEPPQWVFPARQALGGAYLAIHTPQALKEAVKAFCVDLREHQENGRSLYGLARVLHEQHNDDWSKVYGDRYINAWPERWLQDYHLWLLGMPAPPPPPPPRGSGNDAIANPGEERFAVPATAAAPDPKTDPCLLLPSAG